MTNSGFGEHSAEMSNKTYRLTYIKKHRLHLLILSYGSENKIADYLNQDFLYNHAQSAGLKIH